MDPKGLLALLFLVTSLAGCVAGTDDVTDSDLDATQEAVDCEALLEEHEGESEEEHETEEEALPEECADLFEPADPGPPFPLQVDFYGCYGQDAYFYIAGEQLDSAVGGLLPSPYQADTSGPGGTWKYQVFVTLCDRAVYGDTEASDVLIWRDGFYIEPPAGAQDPDIERYWYLWDLTISDDGIAELLEDWGWSLEDARLSWSLTQTPIAVIGETHANEGDYQSLYVYSQAVRAVPWDPGLTSITRIIDDPHDGGDIIYVDEDMGNYTYLRGFGKNQLGPPGVDSDPISTASNAAFYALGSSFLNGFGSISTWIDDGDAPHITLHAGNWETAQEDDQTDPYA